LKVVGWDESGQRTFLPSLNLTLMPARLGSTPGADALLTNFGRLGDECCQLWKLFQTNPSSPFPLIIFNSLLTSTSVDGLPLINVTLFYSQNAAKV
jgi:hypothetical protein